MLNEAVEKKKGHTIEEKDEKEQPLLEIDTAIEDSYVEETELKIEIHQKVNQIDSKEKLIEIKKEIEDRFGKISDTLEIYMYEQWFEKLAHSLSIEQIRQTKNFIELTINPKKTQIKKGEQLFLQATELSKSIRFGSRFSKLIVTLDTIHLDKHYIYYLIDLMEIIKNCCE